MNLLLEALKLYSVEEPWRELFDERELDEIDLALHYMRKPHGTSGHLAYTVIAKLATIADVYQKTVENYDMSFLKELEDDKG